LDDLRKLRIPKPTLRANLAAASRSPNRIRARDSSNRSGINLPITQLLGMVVTSRPRVRHLRMRRSHLGKPERGSRKTMIRRKTPRGVHRLITGMWLPYSFVLFLLHHAGEEGCVEGGHGAFGVCLNTRGRIELTGLRPFGNIQHVLIGLEGRRGKRKASLLINEFQNLNSL
jgi:hypothetical protein